MSVKRDTKTAGAYSKQTSQGIACLGSPFDGALTLSPHSTGQTPPILSLTPPLPLPPSLKERRTIERGTYRDIYLHVYPATNTYTSTTASHRRVNRDVEALVVIYYCYQYIIQPGHQTRVHLSLYPQIHSCCLCLTICPVYLFLVLLFFEGDLQLLIRTCRSAVETCFLVTDTLLLSLLPPQLKNVEIKKKEVEQVLSREEEN